MATLDVVSLAEAKAGLDIGPTDSTHDTELPFYISAVSEMLDLEFGPVVARAVTELHDGSPIAYSSGPGARRGGFSDAMTGGRSDVFTSLRPVSGFTTITEYDIAGNSTVLTAETASSKPVSGYLAAPDPRNPSLFSGRITRRGTGMTTWFAFGDDNISILYNAGRYTNTAAVGGRWKTAAIICLQNFWRSRQQSVGQLDQYETPLAAFPKFGLPNAVADLLATERLYTGSLA